MEPHIVTNLQPYETAEARWNYLKRVYLQGNSAYRFQLEFDIGEYIVKATNQFGTTTLVL